MRVVPVLDLKGGTAVRAVGGDRQHYQPVVGRLHGGADPRGLARQFRRTFGFRELYLADLDAIGGGEPDLPLYGELAEVGLEVWVDAGVRSVADAAPLLGAGVATIVAGLETIDGPATLADLVAAVGADRLVFSIDLRDGRPLVATEAAWGTSDPRELAGRAVRDGVRRILLLDLARVGRGGGTGTLGLLRSLRAIVPTGAELAVGGGVAGPADLEAAAAAGAGVVLVGSALHDGRIGPGMPGLPVDTGDESAGIPQ